MKRQLIVFDFDETLATSIPIENGMDDTVASLITCFDERGTQYHQKHPNSQIKDLPFIFGVKCGISKQDIRTDHISLHNKMQINLRNYDFVTIIRPYTVQLLSQLYMQKQYDIGVFSMGSPDYVYTCTELLKQEVERYINKSVPDLFNVIKNKSHSSVNSSKMRYKDLAVTGYNPDNVLLVDNLVMNFFANKSSGIPIFGYTQTNILHRECNNGQFTYDLGLLRLKHYIDMFNPRKPLIEQNVFRLRD